jgi:RHS repeat-associated protein
MPLAGSASRGPAWALQNWAASCGTGEIHRENGSTVRRYYYAGGVRVAMRSGGQIYYLLGGHLGGTNVTANSSGAQISKLLYKPCPLRCTAGVLRKGETRYSTGTTPTTWRFTGQREDATIGLYYFNARYLDPQLGRFAQPDTIVPEPGDTSTGLSAGPQALNRYSYVLNNALRYTDPTGMFSEDEIMAYLGVSMWDDVLAMFGDGGVMAGAWGFLEVLRQAELGTPVSMWFDVGSGFNASQPNMMGMFSEQDGTLVFSGAFLDWSGAGGSWAIGGLSIVTTSTLLPSTGQYQVGRFGNYLDAQAQYLHVFHPERVDWYDAGVDVFGIVGDVALVAAPGPGTVDIITIYVITEK